jgi:hypothetical protein
MLTLGSYVPFPFSSSAAPHIIDSGHHWSTQKHCRNLVSRGLYTLTWCIARLNLGTTLTPTSGRSSFDFDFIPITPASPTGLRECRDLRIRLSAELLLATENMLTLTLPSPELHDLNKWYDAVVTGFHEFDRLGRMLSHLESRILSIFLFVDLSDPPSLRRHK